MTMATMNTNTHMREAIENILLSSLTVPPITKKTDTFKFMNMIYELEVDIKHSHKRPRMEIATNEAIRDACQYLQKKPFDIRQKDLDTYSLSETEGFPVYSHHDALAVVHIQSNIANTAWLG